MTSRITLFAVTIISAFATQAIAELEVVTTISPFPRGLEVVEGELYVLSRGRVRGVGGVSADVADKAGTIFKVDREKAEPFSFDSVSNQVRENGSVFAEPTSPPFRLWDTTADPAWSDRETDRPYCNLRWHEATQSFYICAFSGVDKSVYGPGRSFSKNLSDGILRYDTRTTKWSEVERHDTEAGGVYPHHDPDYFPAPHGWLNGPNNVLPVGNWLYAVGKDNSLLVRYDISIYKDKSETGAAPSQWILGSELSTTNAGTVMVEGHSALAFRDGWLYVASRTSSHIIRLKLDQNADPVSPRQIELVAEFVPWSQESRIGSDITDMSFDSEGRLYVVNAQPSRVYRFTPDPQNVFSPTESEPWFNFAQSTNNPKMKSENIFIDEDEYLYITSGDGYDFQSGAVGTVYRTKIKD